ncbi:MAG TPA: hypothetical protein VK937_03060 [Candidatus Limnocylindria bacterium]|jgi:hypothetical protein|nr:hypothetical protein [Candidatus Limnocylindria bacterium]
MVMKSGERWHCVNPACGCVVLVESNGEIEGQNPRCARASIMKKSYTPPVSRSLDFLRFPEPAFIHRDSSEDGPMRGGVIHQASGVRPSKSLVVRGGLVRTFRRLAGFLVVTLLCWGIHTLDDVFLNPLSAGDAAVIGAAFVITLAAMLLFFLIKPGKRPRMTGHGRTSDSAVPAVCHSFDPAAGAVRQDNLRNNLAYQRFYVDHSRIRR